MVRTHSVPDPGGAAPDLTWALEVVGGTPQELHDLDVPPRRLARVHLPDSAAVVLGSTQDPRIAQPGRAAGLRVAVAKRRSGGGAVWLAPGEVVWVDLVVPSGDPLWLDDIARAATWVGRAWAEALSAAAAGGARRRRSHGDPGRIGGVPRFEVWHGPVVGRELGRFACFAGLAPGEVTMRFGEGPVRKVVGVSQRRTRALARFQSVVYLHWDPEPLIRVLAAEEVCPALGDALRLRAAAPAVGLAVPATGSPAEADQVVTALSDGQGLPGGIVLSGGAGALHEQPVPGWGLVERLLQALPGD